MARALDYVRNRWVVPGGYREVMVLAFPLILSTGAWSVQHFVDRMFLKWYSNAAVAAAMPAGLLNFTLASIFIGTASYVSTFVAQYYGAGRHERVGPALWQGIYVAVIGAVVLAAAIPFARPFFARFGHSPDVLADEVTYFRILCMWALPSIASAALAGYFSGLGRTWAVMGVNVLATAVNLGLDYVLIFGGCGIPPLGIAGAAIATGVSFTVSCAAYLVLLGRGEHVGRFGAWHGWRFDAGIFRRLIRFGFPSGAQMFLDVAGFTVFLLLVGRLGELPQAATSVAFNINTLAFMPMFGMGIAVSVLVGQHLGANRPEVAERSVYSGFHLTFCYMGTIAAAYVLVPGLFLAPYAARTTSEEFAPMAAMVVVMLRFIALYSIFDTLNIIFASALRGAGDTRFVMVMIGAVSLLVLVVPTYAALMLLGGGIWAAWVIVSAYVIVLGFSFLARFMHGRWKSMRVIEEVPVSLAPPAPEAPTADL